MTPTSSNALNNELKPPLKLCLCVRGLEVIDGPSHFQTPNEYVYLQDAAARLVLTYPVYRNGVLQRVSDTSLPLLSSLIRYNHRPVCWLSTMRELFVRDCGVRELFVREYGVRDCRVSAHPTTRPAP